MTQGPSSPGLLGRPGCGLCLSEWSLVLRPREAVLRVRRAPSAQDRNDPFLRTLLVGLENV